METDKKTAIEKFNEADLSCTEPAIKRYGLGWSSYRNQMIKALGIEDDSDG